MKLNGSDLPSISIITCSYNPSLKMFRESLHALKMQKYPRNKIEHVVLDGGSTSNVRALVKEFGCKFISRPDLQIQAQKRMSIGICLAKNDLIVIVEPDNIVIGQNWLLQMVTPFVEAKEVICSFSMYNAVKKNMPALARYAAYFGTSDPTLYYLKKSEKIPQFVRNYDVGSMILKKKEYTLVSFTKDTLPTLGDNGHMIRRDVYQRVNTNPDTFTHTDMFVRLLEKGYSTYAAVPNNIIHYPHESLSKLLMKRLYYKSFYYDRMRGKRKYLVYNPYSNKDRFNLFLYLLFSLTFIQPLLLSIKGFRHTPDVAWFLHPIVCFLMTVVYAFSEIKFMMKKHLL